MPGPKALLPYITDIPLYFTYCWVLFVANVLGGSPGGWPSDRINVVNSLADALGLRSPLHPRRCPNGRIGHYTGFCHPEKSQFVSPPAPRMKKAGPNGPACRLTEWLGGSGSDRTPSA